MAKVLHQSSCREYVDTQLIYQVYLKTLHPASFKFRLATEMSGGEAICQINQSIKKNKSAPSTEVKSFPTKTFTVEKKLQLFLELCV